MAGLKSSATNGNSSTRRVRLKDHEIRLLDLLAAGHLAREIAQIEGIPLPTVSSRIHQIKQKLNLESVGSGHGKGQLLEWMARNGWEVSALRFEGRPGFPVSIIEAVQ